MTLDQARTYLTLVQIGPATAKSIAEASKITRPDIYRIIPALQEEGLIETLVTKPTRFQAVPVKQVLPIMLERKTTEQNNLRTKIEEFLYDSQKNRLANNQDVEATKDFIIVLRKVAIIEKLEKALDKSQISVCTVTSKKRFSSAIVTFEQGYREALRRNVKVRICSEKQVVSGEALRILKSLSLNPDFQVKFFLSAPQAIVSVYDGEEASVTMTADAHLAGASALWSNNPCFVALAQNYFENYWSKASAFKNALRED